VPPILLPLIARTALHDYTIKNKHTTRLIITSSFFSDVSPFLIGSFLRLRRLHARICFIGPTTHFGENNRPEIIQKSIDDACIFSEWNFNKSELSTRFEFDRFLSFRWISHVQIATERPLRCVPICSDQNKFRRCGGKREKCASERPIFGLEAPCFVIRLIAGPAI
jgi:hypothetical protein